MQRLKPDTGSFWDVRVCKRMLAVAMAGLMAGCSAIRYGGAPEPSFDVDKDLKQLAEKFEPAASISDFYTKNTKEARDEFITGRITMMNIRYIQFVRSLTSEKELLDTAVALLTLGLNIAGASVAAASTKTVLAAISAGVIGSKEAIDKNYFFDKTIPALVSQMNAERKKALIPLLVGSKQELPTELRDGYSFEQAVTDLNDYYFAGTFAGAIQGIQVDAAKKEKEQDEIIATLTPITREVVIKKRSLSESIYALTNSDLSKIKETIKKLQDAKSILGPLDLDQKCPATDLSVHCQDIANDSDFRHLINTLHAYVRGARNDLQIENVTKIFKDAGIQ